MSWNDKLMAIDSRVDSQMLKFDELFYAISIHNVFFMKEKNGKIPILFELSTVQKCVILTLRIIKRYFSKKKNTW